MVNTPPTLSEVIHQTVTDWRTDYTYFKNDPFEGENGPRMVAALSKRLTEAIRDALTRVRDGELEIAEGTISLLEDKVKFYEQRQDESGISHLAELQEAYTILGVLAHRQGGIVQITEQDRLLAMTLEVNIEQSEETGDVTISATGGN